MKTACRQTRRILFADDDLGVREITKMLLADYGHRVTTTDCGSEALRVFSVNPGCFDLVILDQEMPGPKGTDIAPGFLALRSAMPIVLYTGFLDDDLAKKARKAGIKEIALKPLPIDMFLDLIDRNSINPQASRRRQTRGMECGWTP
jgi:DNA-binding NtrC family response regulator